MGSTALLRACVLGDGTVKAIFEDCSLILLSPGASAFLHVDSSGQAVQQCTNFALHKWLHKLHGVLELRNQHCSSVSVCKPFLSRPRPGFTSAVPVAAVRWPSNVPAARQLQLLTVAEDGQVTLVSEDRCAKLVLHPSGLRLTVTWPVQAAGGAQQSYWVTQSFSAGDCPAAWAEAPLRLAMAAQLQCAMPPPQDESELQLGLYDPDFALTPAQRTSQLPAAASTAGIECCTFPQQSWWFDTGTASFPADVPIVLEWTRDAVYQYLPALQQVEVHIHADESLLRMDRKGYLQHYLPSSWRTPKTYAAQAVPSFVWGSQAGARYPLAMIASHAQALREISAKLYSLGRAPGVSPLSGKPIVQELGTAAPAATCQAHTCPDTPLAAQEPPVPDTTVAERQVVPGHGTFTAFADGGVHVRFDDRTLLKLLPSRQHFEALLPSGQAVCGLVSRPAELQPYMAQALEFACWAGHSPLERAAPLQRHQQVQAQLSSTSRQAALCHLALHPGLHDGGSGASGGAPPCCAASFQGSSLQPGLACGESPALAGRASSAWGPGIGEVGRGKAAFSSCGFTASAGAGAEALGGAADYMWQLVSSSSLGGPRSSMEREAVVEAWLRRNALLLDQL